MTTVLGDWPIPNDPSSVRRARNLVVEHARRVGVADHAEDVRLAASELLTNAVVHGGKTICIRVTTDWQVLRVEVHDNGTRPVGEAAGGELRETGRGLDQIVAHVTETYGITHEPGRGTVAWFEVKLL